jgi:hypothetical protein
MARQQNSDQDPEILAITQVYAALRGLDAGAQQRVLDYVSRKLNLSGNSRDEGVEVDRPRPSKEQTVAADNALEDEGGDARGDDELEGISPVAKKWMRRSGFSSDQLSNLFSLGVDEIDLVTKSVPGTSVRDKMRSVVLLKGLAAYLGTGAARISYEQIKEACLHYGAFDNTNFARYLRTMASEVSGTRESGYTVTARGLTEATELVRGLLGQEDK